jgi:hypothetical protein
MADTRISSLAPGAPAQGTDETVIARGGSNYKLTVSEITGYLGLPITIANGGTGSSSPQYCSLTSNVTGTLPVSNGGTGQTSYTNGQLLIGNTTGNTLTKATLTAGTGINITNGAGSITIAASSSLVGTTTSSVTAIGVEAGDSLTSGTGNTFFGYQAGTAVTTSVNGLFVGYQAGAAATGSNNTAIGYQAGDSITTGTNNVLTGGTAGTNITTGTFNSFFGYNAGAGVTTGALNSALGDNAFSIGNYSNSTCIGELSQVTGNDQIQLGKSGTTTYAYGAVQDRSDARDKTDIRDTELGLNFILALRPREFKWDMREDYRTVPPSKPEPINYPSDVDYQAALGQWKIDYANWEEASKLANITHDGTHKRNRFHQGLIAQEVKQTMDELGVDFGGYQDHTIKGGDAVLTIGYEELIAPLIKAIQELKTEFDAYKQSHS